MDGRSQPQLLRRPYKPADGGEERNYFLYVPTGFYTETGREWPVMLFLHGAGERGNGNDELDITLMHGPVMEAWIQGRDLPFLIIQPQTSRGDRGNPPDLLRVPQRNPDGPPPPRNYGSRSEKPMARVETGDLINWSERNARATGGELLERDVLTMIYETIADFRGDEDRVYCTGLNMGGRATWRIAQNHPERFAAVAPVCGDADPSKMQPIADAKTAHLDPRRRARHHHYARERPRCRQGPRSRRPPRSSLHRPRRPRPQRLDPRLRRRRFMQLDAASPPPDRTTGRPPAELRRVSGGP